VDEMTVGIEVQAMLTDGKIVKKSFKGAFYDEAKALEEKWFEETGAELIERKIINGLSKDQNKLLDNARKEINNVLGV
jgi:hypothetical protein